MAEEQAIIQEQRQKAFTLQIPTAEDQSAVTPVMQTIEVSVIKADGSEGTIQQTIPVLNDDESVQTWGDLVEAGIRQAKGIAKQSELIFQYDSTNADLSDLAQKSALWNFGCPRGCGASFVLKPTEDLSQWELPDSALKVHLSWVENLEYNSRCFVCPHCGAVITLESRDSIG